MKKVVFLFCLWLISADLNAQDKTLLDSLHKINGQKLSDSSRAMAYYQLSRAYRHHKFDSSSWYAKEGIKLARKINFEKGVAANLNALGTLELNQGNYLTALKFALEALNINEKIGNEGEIANTKNNIGEVYRLLRNYQNALKYYQEALIVNKKIGYKLGISINLNNMGEICTAQGDYARALDYLQQSLEICKELKDKRRIALRYNNIGEVYEKQNKNAQAKQYLEQALALNYEIGNKLQQSVALCNLAKIALKEGILDLEKAEKAYQIAQSLKAKREASNALEIIVQTLEKQKKYQSAFEHYKLFNQYKDSISIEQADKQTKQIQYDYEINKKEKEILLLEHNKKVQEQKQKTQFLYILAFGIALVLLALLALLQYRRRLTEKQNRQILHEKNEEILHRQAELISQKELIEEQNQDIEKAYQRMLRNERKLEKTIDQLKVSEASIESQRKELEIKNDKINGSIKAAHVIQQVILPSKEKIETLLPKSFVLYMPKDIVSGDFWWLNEIDNKAFLATVDCTGHGVAGAFMTMIGNTLLDKIVRLRGVHSPAEILEAMHEDVQSVLRQKENKNNNGMDMSILCLQKISAQETQLTFAGAKQSVYYIEAERTDEIFELKGTRKAIGGEQNEHTHFENQTITLKSGSWIYTGSDGLPDQNNAKRKRFGEQQIKEILLQNAPISLEAQKNALQKALNAHMEGTEQRDDILWIGFQL